MSFTNSNSKLRLTRWSINAALTLLLIGSAYAAHSYWIAAIQADRQLIAQQIDEIGKQLEKSDRIASEHSRLLKLKQSIEKKTKSIAVRIPNQPNEGEFLKQTTKAAENCSISIREYRRQGIEADGNHSRLIIRMSVEGTFAGLCQFMNALERLPRISKVSQLNIKASTIENSTYPMDLTLILFFRTTPQERIARAKHG